MKKNSFIAASFILSILSLILSSGRTGSPVHTVMRIFDYSILLLTAAELASGLASAQYRLQYIRRSIGLSVFFCLYLSAMIYLSAADMSGAGAPVLNLLVVIIRSLFILYRSVENIRSVKQAVARLNERPALSIIMSFFVIIMTGTLLLMLPSSTADGFGLSFIDSWFTATSAVCVTGLIVVDTAAAFSLSGKLIILTLIQIGGLGIMIISYISMFILGRKMSIEEKQRLNFVISDADMSDIVKTLKKIIYLTVTIEGTGALLLFAGIGAESGFTGRTAFLAVFHSVSAFCNAGFALFSDSLEGFSSSPSVIFVISALIILGGLSFAVIFNIRDYFSRKSRVRKLNLNSRVVLSWTAGLTTSGFLLFYALEHGNVLRSMSTPAQYLAAFFQSVTLRTAGFNSIAFADLGTATLLIMCIYMFIGAASGSTAGGIKINTTAVIFAYIKSIAKNSPSITLYRHQLSERRVLRAFAVFGYGIAAVTAGTALLALAYPAPLEQIIFEAVSAFGTVGLSTGLTPQLNTFGKIIIIFLMFNGRLGPLTILSTFSGRRDSSGVRYPGGDISIG